jgi:hypothetical protein
MILSLSSHPETPSRALSALDVEVHRGTTATLQIRFRLHGDVAALKLPKLTHASRIDELWKQTCFEAFVRSPAEESYFEFNFSPSTQWAAYAFDSYRAGMRNADIDAPTIQFDPVRGEMNVQLLLPALAAAPTWRLGLCAVIEEQTGAKSYWALKHPAGKPDFHHPDCFAAEISAAKEP